MNNTDTHITLESFIKAWDKKCNSSFNLSYMDLPDILLIDDYWHESMTKEEAVYALNDMMNAMKEELGSDDIDL
jgi:hypothetical protein